MEKVERKKMIEKTNFRLKVEDDLVIYLELVLLQLRKSSKALTEGST